MLCTVLLASTLIAAQPAVPESLAWAGRFADALRSDEKERQRAQEAVVLDIAARGALDEAIRRAERVEGWRRGVAWAEIAKEAAKRGRVGEARVLIGKASELAARTEGWQGPRIEAHVAQARALVGEMDASLPLTERLVQGDELQYRGLPAVMRATGLAAKGDLAAALAELDRVAGEAAIEMAWPATKAYLEIARHPELGPAQRLKALGAARRLAQSVAEQITKLDLLELVADGYREAGLREEAEATLADFHGIVSALPDSTVLKAPYLAGEARIRARLGGAAAARPLLAAARDVAAQAYPIDRPAVLANVAAGYHVAGDAETSRTVLASALTAAEGLVNARPRAVAFVEIGRVLARFDVPMTPSVRQRFEAALGGLRDPW